MYFCVRADSAMTISNIMGIFLNIDPSTIKMAGVYPPMGVCCKRILPAKPGFINREGGKACRKADVGRLIEAVNHEDHWSRPLLS